MRNLVTIQKITKIEPIENADRIEIASVLGWKVVIKKGEFAAGDLCIYFEIDSFLPVIPMFEFLRNNSYKKAFWETEDGRTEGFRIKTQKLRGQISQGLILPLSALDEVGTMFTDRKVKKEEGGNVTDVFHVIKWDPPEMDTGTGTVKGDLPHGVYKTDETRIQTIPEILNEMKGLPYYITTKMDGTSVSMYVKDGVFGITGHKKEYLLDDNCLFYKWAKKNGVPDKIRSLQRNIAFQGEFCGPKIQNNRCGLKDYGWFVFNIQNLNTLQFLDFEEARNLCETIGIEMVPVVEIGKSFDYTEDELLERADGQYPSGKRREGIVIRPQKETYSDVLMGRLSFKVINNKYLLKND